MADFCSQCSIETFNEDHGDLKGLITQEKVSFGYVQTVLCEGCGPTYVNHLGECRNPTCGKRHGSKDVQR
jgi:hypothetical protein